MPRQFNQLEEMRTVRASVYFGIPKTDKNNYGNFGLYDQVNALKWVHDEIHHFGGGEGSLNELYRPYFYTNGLGSVKKARRSLLKTIVK